jgi:hypothetical protein
MCKEKLTSFQVVVENCSESISLLKKTLDSIKLIDYDNKWYGTVLSATKTKEWNQIPSYVNELQQENYLIIAAFHLSGSESSHETFCFSSYRSTDYYCKINCGDVIKSNFFKEVHKNSSFEFIESENVCAIKSSVAINNYLNFLNYDLMQKDLKTQSKKRKKYLKI